MMIEREFPLRVWYCDTDQMGIVHHSNYIRYYESARSDFMREIGMSYGEMEEQGVMMPILDVQSKYRRPAYYDEILTVKVILKELPQARITFYYEISNSKGELINEGSTTLGFMKSDTRRPVRAPQWFVEGLQKLESSQ